MSYLEFLARWYNLPYMAGLAVSAAAFLRLPPTRRLGDWLGGLLKLQEVSGRFLLLVFGLSFGILGLTFNGALHDYWRQWQEIGAVPGFVLAAAAALLITRTLGRVQERHFPRYTSVKFGSPELEGYEGRVVSRVVSPQYRAGRAQVMEEGGTLHVVLCKTSSEEIPYSATVRLQQYDPDDGRYFVETIDSEGRTTKAGNENFIEAEEEPRNLE